MKKTIAILMAGLLALGMVGCSNEPAATETLTPTPTNTGSIQMPGDEEAPIIDEGPGEQVTGPTSPADEEVDGNTGPTSPAEEYGDEIVTGPTSPADVVMDEVTGPTSPADE